MRKRIWELDALRGFSILMVILIHLTYDLVVLYDVWDLKNPWLFDLGQDWGGVAFLVLSGICVTLGSRPIRRGLAVFGCGMIITAVTAGMYLLHFTGKGIIIYFGVLHCLGICMLLSPAFKKLPAWLLGILGVWMIAAGLYLVRNVSVDFPWLIPFGVPSHNFYTSDYFPLLPNLGYFLVGITLGKTVYRSKQTLLPKVNTGNPVIRFLSFCGRHSLLIYMLHQPVLAGLIAVFLYL